MVVLPLVPVMVSHGAGPTAARIRQASSTSPQTGMPAARGREQQRLVGRHPGEVMTRSGAAPSGIPATCSGAQPHVHPEDVEDAGPLPQRGVGVGVGAVDGHHPRTALVQRVGRREAADTQTCHHHAHTTPVGAAAGQTVEPPAHAAPTTHSA